MKLATSSTAGQTNFDSSSGYRLGQQHIQK